MRRMLAIALIAAAPVLVACGDEDDQPATTPAAEAPSGEEGGGASESEAESNERKRKQPRPGTEIVIAESQFGPVIFDDSKQAIYLFDKERTSKPECYGDCAAEWPPVLTKGEPVAADGARQGLLGTTKRDDGSAQVTYAGQPLYYYAHEGPGEVLCHNVSGFGGLWLVLGADGKALS